VPVFRRKYFHAAGNQRFDPRRRAYAAIDADVFPVDTHATRRIPSLRACAMPHVIPLSLNDPVG